jgi:hypothetical protein
MRSEDALKTAQTAIVQFGELMSEAQRMSDTVPKIKVPYVYKK